MSTPSEDQTLPGDQLRKEIWAVIRRYGKESDVSIYTVLGTLEVVKADLIEGLTETTREEDEG